MSYDENSAWQRLDILYVVSKLKTSTRDFFDSHQRVTILVDVKLQRRCLYSTDVLS